MDLRHFAEFFSQVHWLGDKKFKSRCPCPTHQDGDPDLSLIARESNGRISIACFADLGDTTDSILKSMGLTATDLRVESADPKPPPRQPRPQERPAEAPRMPAATFSRRMPPQNLEAEQSVLGAVLLDNEGLATARKIVTGRDFYRDIHRTLFGAMCELADMAQPIDALTLRTWLLAHNKLEQVGGAPYIAELASVTPHASSVGSYATLVRDVAIKRRVAADASDLIEMTYNGVQTDSLLGEWQRRVTVLDRGLSVPADIPWESAEDAEIVNGEYLQRKPIIDRLCYSSAVSMITGGKHAGKSTLARWMAICVSKGISFLGRDVMQGPVLYVASEDEEMVARLELIQLGWRVGDPLKFFGKSKIRSDDFDFLRHLTQAIKRYQAVLVVLDMLFDFVHIDDEMSYAGTRRAVGKVQDVASESEAHICTVHHAPKNAAIGDATIAALGSQGLAARVSPIILVRRFGPEVHSISSTGVRDPRGEGIPDSRLVRNADGSVDLGGAFKGYMLAEVYVPRLLDIIDGDPDAEFTILELAEALGQDTGYAVTRQSLAMMYRQGMVERRGTGKKGSPYRYCSKSNTPSDDTEKETYRGYVSDPPDAKPTRKKASQESFEYKKNFTPPGDDAAPEPEGYGSSDKYGISKGD